MRVSEALKFGLVSRGLGNLQTRYLKSATQATTGQRINAPSDDPTAAAEAIRIRSGMSGVEGIGKTINSVQGDVELAESTLAQAGDILQRLREVAISGSSDSVSAEQRAALAQQATDLREQVLGLANTRGSRGYLFSGTLLNVSPIDTAGNFQGNDEQQLVDLGTGDPVAVNVSGARAFTAAGGRNVIQTMDDLVNALKGGDSTAVRATLDAITGSNDQIQTERARAGLLLNRLELSSTLMEQAGIDLAKRKNSVIDADMATTLTSLTQLQSAIGNSLAVGKQVLSLSALDRF